MFRKIIIIIILSTLGFKFTPVAYASTLFSDPVSGTTGTNWNYPGWTYHNSLYGIYDLFGAHGLYYPWKDTGTQDQIIKWTYHYGNAQDILSIRCRISYDGLNTEQVTYYPNMTPTIDEGVNGLYTLRTNFLATTTGIVNGELDCIGNTLKYKENGIVKASYTMNPANIATGVAFYSSGSGDTSISNIQICDINGCDTSPSLPVPLLKQTDINLGLQLYDSADQWDPQHSTIADWGCALTSAAMILQYYHIDKLPDGTPLDPGTLNTWLKSHQDGYVNGGWVNWLAIANLTHQAKLSGQDPNFAYDALEYINSPKDDSLLTQDLNNQQPDILEEPGHFVVGTGQTDNSFSINDPYYTRTDLNQGYNNTYLSLGRYIPSHTDLSYIMMTSDPSLTLTLTDSNNISTGSSYIQNPITDPQNPTITSGNPLRFFYAPKPVTGTYFLTVSGQPNQPYSVNVYFYDKDGNTLDPITLTGTLNTTGTNASEIHFDNHSVNNDQVNPAITFDILLNDISRFQNTNDIKNGPSHAFSALAESANKSAQKKNIIPAKVQLIALQGLLDVFHNRGISDEAYTVINFETRYLLNSF